MKFRRFLSSAAVSILLTSALVSAQEPTKVLTADEIINKANLVSYYGGEDGRSLVKMHLVSQSGKERYRELTILRKDVIDGEDQKFYVYFHKPGDVRKMVFMVWKHVEKDDDRWLYIPAIDLVKRISASDKRGSFAGSNFTYEDVSGRGPEEDTHTLVKEEMLGDKETYLIKHVPKDPDLVEFSSYLTWIDKETFLPLKADYFDKQEKLYRTVTAEETAIIQGIPTVVKAKAFDVASGNYTLSEFEEIKYNIGLKDDIFTERYLRRPPAQWLNQ